MYSLRLGGTLFQTCG